jgi:hypothetical protein
MVDLEEGKRLRRAMDTASDQEYGFAMTDWQSWAVTHARDLIDEVEGLRQRLNSPRIWTEADEAAFQAMPKEDWSFLLEDSPDPTLDGDPG